MSLLAASLSGKAPCSPVVIFVVIFGLACGVAHESALGEEVKRVLIP